MFLRQNDDGLSIECGYLKYDIIRLCQEYETLTMEKNDEKLDYIEIEEESLIERIFNK